MENQEDRWREFGAVVGRLIGGENIKREEAKPKQITINAE